MNTIKFLALACAIVFFFSCEEDDGPTNRAPVVEDRTMNMDENPTSDLLTTITATDADDDTLTYSIVSQTPANSVLINSTNGEVYIANASAFDYEQNTSIVVNIEVTDGVNITQSTLTINILDVNENG
ncbi:cadherin repeat domain-containing protein [Hyunsoonleella sp. SJ7]|uniref:Cadherin repeat domain-containing protein n=1 Tax=Hyunsoonleella aquatilis TaxID=2762758 RepID=A0A923HCR2_9FLAO|nr:cadherin repeat domain-containing protein [Hyunsoonleella aquatilis]MBC3759492.1 cadherin repeat domain-containing protein [Hyunsoonleella aquatilis]